MISDVILHTYSAILALIGLVLIASGVASAMKLGSITALVSSEVKGNFSMEEAGASGEVELIDSHEVDVSTSGWHLGGLLIAVGGIEIVLAAILAFA